MGLPPLCGDFYHYFSYVTLLAIKYQLCSFCGSQFREYRKGRGLMLLDGEGGDGERRVLGGLVALWCWDVAS